MIKACTVCSATYDQGIPVVTGQVNKPSHTRNLPGTHRPNTPSLLLHVRGIFFLLLKNVKLDTRT